MTIFPQSMGPPPSYVRGFPYNTIQIWPILDPFTPLEYAVELICWWLGFATEGNENGTLVKDFLDICLTNKENMALAVSPHPDNKPILQSWKTLDKFNPSADTKLG